VNDELNPYLEGVTEAITPFARFFAASTYSRKAGDPGICDFVAGNPQEMALPEFVAALRKWIEPQDKNWFAYKRSEPAACEAVAGTLRRVIGLDFEPDDIVMTRGASTAIAMCLRTVVGPGDEVVYITPPWFFYEAMIRSAGASPVKVAIDRTTFDPDVDAIAAAITPKTRALILNTPHNPTGRIARPEVLRRLADVLSRASEANGRPIFVIADEPYNRIIFDGHDYHSPTEFYPNTFLCYSYGKTLLTPGMRLGYIAMPPSMPDRERLRMAFMVTGMAGGYGVPDAVMQYAVPDLENVSIDIAHLQSKRDRLVQELGAMGYEMHVPEATFYLVVQAPIEDDVAYTEMLAQHDVFVLPGVAFDMPGYFRISFTASDDMIERSLAGFRQALAEAREPATT
jgi:aspartate aminotransferase